MPTPEAIIRKFTQLEGARKNWDTYWQKISDLLWPAAANFTTTRQPGAERTEQVYDPTAALALEKFAAALESLLTPRSQKWHRLRATDEDLNKNSEVKEWLEEANRVLFAIRNSPRANYYSQKHEGYKSLGAFGTEALFVDDFPGGGLRYKNCHMARIFIDTDHFGSIDTVFFKYPLSAKAAVQRWGPERISAFAPMVAKAFAVKPWTEFEFLHAVVPRMGVDPERVDFRGMPWAAYDLSIQDKSILEEGGYHELPYMIGRYTINPSEKYGRSPAMLVFPAVRTLQEMEKTHIRSGHKVADPPLLLYDDGVLGAGSNRVKLRPGGLTWGGLDDRGNELIKPLVTGARLDITEAMMERKRESINDAFLVTLFQILVEKPNMTATEVLERAQEKGILIAPAVGRQQSETLGPQIHRELKLLLRKGALAPMPEIFREAEGEYEIEYESQATLMQRNVELAGIRRTIEMLDPFVAAGNTAALDIFKTDEIARLSAEIGGVPLKVLRTPEELEEMQAATVEAGEERQLAEEVPVATGALKDVAAASKAMSEAKAA